LGGCGFGLVEDDVGPAPGLVVDEPPFVAGAGGVFGDEDVARVDGEGFAAVGGEFEGAGEGDDELCRGGVVPVEA